MGFSALVGRSLVKTANMGSALSTVMFHPPASRWWPFYSTGFYAVRPHGNEIFLAGVISTGN